jgi:ketosteroid isomerase-like protein
MRSPREIAELTCKMVAGDTSVVFADLFAADGVMEFPYAPPGFWPTLDGQAKIREFYDHARGVRKLFDQHGVSSMIYETADPEVVITEIEHHGVSHVTNAPYQIRAVGVIRVRAGEIVHYRDYMNPVAVAQLTGRTADLIESLSGAGTGAGR